MWEWISAPCKIYYIASYAQSWISFFFFLSFFWVSVSSSRERACISKRLLILFFCHMNLNDAHISHLACLSLISHMGRNQNKIHVKNALTTYKKISVKCDVNVIEILRNALRCYRTGEWERSTSESRHRHGFIFTESVRLFSPVVFIIFYGCQTLQFTQ